VTVTAAHRPGALKEIHPVTEPLPVLPTPEFTVIPLGSSPEVPAAIAAELLGTGIPGGLIGYEYRPLPEAEFLAGIRQSGVVAVATSGLFGRICVDAATGEIVQIPKVDYPTATHVNRDLHAFTRCVEAVIAHFPFYEEEDSEERFEEAADEVRALVAGIDDSALVHNGFWETLCEDVAMGDYSDWDEDE
jgi:hypothetical protein